MNIRAIKSVEAQAAVDRIKKMTKREVKDFSTDIPKEFLEKRIYMQSDEFLKDEHNVKMFEFGEQLGELREKIGKEINESNKSAGKDELVQGINGFARVKEYLDTNYQMNFSDLRSFHTPNENRYAILKKFKIGNLAREVKNILGLK